MATMDAVVMNVDGQHELLDGSEKKGNLHMPIKDPERRREVSKAWRKKTIAQGYGKLLYARRKAKYEDAEEFRTVLDMILSPDIESLDAARLLASRAIRESEKRQESLGRWKEDKLKRDLEEKQKNGS